MTVAVMVILTLGVIPLVQVSVKRQREQRLREALREVRAAIDQFHREAVIAQCAGLSGSTAVPTNGPVVSPPGGPAGGPNTAAAVLDPRVKVMIADCKIFGVDNPDRYPPDLETLVKGVDVIPYGSAGLGRRGDLSVTALEATKSEATKPKTKVYLRSLPVDPMTGKADWVVCSSYDTPDNCKGEENVFNVRSKSKDTALNGEKYSDW